MLNVAPIGHNNPPDSDIDTVRTRLDIREKAIRDQLALVTKTSPPESIADEKEAGDITEILKSLIVVGNDVAKAHKEVKAPYLECGNAVDAWKRGLEAELAIAKKSYEAPMKDYLDRRATAERKRQLEEAQKERERAEALAAEAAAHDNAGIADTAGELMDEAINSEAMAERIELNAYTAKPSALAKARSFSGASASQKLVWTGEIENLSAIDLNLLRNNFVGDAIQKAVDSFVRGGGRKLDGVNIWEKPTLSIR